MLMFISTMYLENTSTNSSQVSYHRLNKPYLLSLLVEDKPSIHMLIFTPQTPKFSIVFC